MNFEKVPYDCVCEIISNFESSRDFFNFTLASKDVHRVIDIHWCAPNVVFKYKYTPKDILIYVRILIFENKHYEYIRIFFPNCTTLKTGSFFWNEVVIGDFFLEISKTKIVSLKLSHIISVNGSYEEIRAGRKITNCSQLSMISNEIPKYNITTLDLSGTGIETPGVIYIATMLLNSKLSSLILSDNKIMSKGASEIANVLCNSNLTYLDLSLNYIGPKGMKEIATAVPTCKLTYLDLSGNWCGNVKKMFENIKIKKLLL